MPLKTIKMLADDKNYFLRDPALVFYADLAKHDGLVFPSDDKYGHQLTVTGATWTPQGRSFDGTDDRINCGVSAAFNTTLERTILIWVKATNVTGVQEYIYKWDDGSVDRAYTFYSNNGVMGTAATATADSTDAGRVGATTMVLNNWYCVGSVFLASRNLDIFTNGLLDNGALTGTVPAMTRTSAANLCIGSRGTAAYGQADIAKVLMCNRALSPSEIQNYYLMTKGDINE